ncbi:guanitoxin biosynthesis PLP-dependent (S)-gamma-hydroxy-L-arginine cyclodehydratase GntC [Paenibacillus polysaccharolyticus]|uniref:guanitoxin biosynthesis PLP-dependent (S)-gamma-hydroxy-L-arginine cyclodehydratase GntC n=1 Tax=Paenibacillus polysaccharolyticus TaxID=582692 RepID=UPI00280BBBD8|nr:guanitoxin biosynthesis PLP-dependent (S)-gamma-hydroxy-L-arginine cyclodehydratase GntC [Paenibacillus polysaccharolyticus]
MQMALHLMEPWLIENQYTKFNLGESGIEDRTLGEVLELTETKIEELLQCSFKNNDTYGSLQLRTSIASFYDNVSPEEIIVTTGVSEAVFIYYHLRYEPGANVIVPFPAFQTLYEVPKYLGYEVRLLDLKTEEGFKINIESLKSMIDNNTKIIVLNNPHNPTGALLTDSEVAEIIQIAEQYGIEILADEHYRFIPYGDEDLIPSLYGKSECVVAVGSMIKCLACVGLRVGWVVADRTLVDQIRDFKDYTTHTICSINDFLAYRLLLHWEKIGMEHKSWVLENIIEFRKLVARHNSVIDWIEPKGGIVAFPFLKDKSISSQHFAERLIENTEVSVLPGEVFERPGHFRIGFGLHPDKFRGAMERMSQFLTAKAWE